MRGVSSIFYRSVRIIPTYASAALSAVLLVAVPDSVTAQGVQPNRVVSMNLCTDQMAMLVAAPGQLLSVSHIASDPISSALADQADKYAVNHGLAEEIFLMKPDLVLAGTYTTRATVSLLQRLGIRVEEFAPESSFDEVRTNLTRMGELLGQPQRAAHLIGEMDMKLAKATRQAHPELTVATWYANSYTSGSGTLVDGVVKAAGMKNLADQLGYAGTAQLPLEMLILSAPDMIVGGKEYEAPSLADQNFEHPAFAALSQRTKRVDIPPRYTICGSPFTAEAVKMLSDAAGNMPRRQPR